VRALVAHRQTHGHLFLRPLGDYQLYHWACEQRRLWQLGRLDLQIEARLRRIGLPFDAEECTWEQVFARLCGAVAKWGTPPRRAGALGTWVESQRAMQRRGVLSTERERRLRRLGALK
jgi:hypothetical protein